MHNKNIIIKLKYIAHTLFQSRYRILINLLIYIYLLCLENITIVDCMDRTGPDFPLPDNTVLNNFQGENIEDDTISDFDIEEQQPLDDTIIFEAYPMNEYSLGTFLGTPLLASTNPYWCCFLAGFYYVPFVLGFGLMGYLCITASPCIITGIYATAVAEEPALQIFQYNFHSCMNYTETFLQSLF